MDVLRRNTDYALRAMVHLAKNGQNSPVSARQIAKEEDISYELACKLLQRLQKSGLVSSTMGKMGGFSLGLEPSKISLGSIIEAIQGKISLNRCLIGNYKCPKGSQCPVYEKLACLQHDIDNYFERLTLAELVHKNSKLKGKHNVRKNR
ncbi:MAG: Rrf2 family transcriptional regulator [Phycisphaerae bacterium]